MKDWLNRNLKPIAWISITAITVVIWCTILGFVF
jgi:hypothetical protein